MPRKCPFKALFYGACKGGGFRNNNPDKGTETFGPHAIKIMDGFAFRNNNPDKGTETLKEVVFTAQPKPFRNNNPDKGTETSSN